MPVKTNIQTLNGAKIIIETLKKNSVDTILGYPGGVVLDLYDELYKQSDIKHILVRHEQFAVHAAEGYARKTGKCGVVLVTAGPGATNTVTGIANAYLDGYPLVVLTGQVLGNDAFQHTNICEITKTCSKAVFQIDKASEIENILNKAFEIATEGKKGPVVVSLVNSIFKDETEYFSDKAHTIDNKINNFTLQDITRIQKRILNAQKPIAIVGGGVHHSNAYDEIEKFVKLYNLPVVSSMAGTGAYNTAESNYYGMIGIYGDDCANELVKQSDLIISFGCRFNDRITSKFEHLELLSKLVMIDINSDLISTLNPSDFLIGDIKGVIAQLNYSFKGNSANKYIEWDAFANTCKQNSKSNYKISNVTHGFEVIQKLDDYTKNMDVTFTSDVGQHQLLAVKNLTLNKNRRLFLSCGAGTMGFGLPAAIGAAIASLKSTVVCITGDGSFQMSLSELALCKDLGLNIKVVILNNGYLGMVRQLQEQNCAGRYSQTKIFNPDFVQLAQSYGLKGLKVHSLNEIDSALEQAFSDNDTFILDFCIESMEIV